jgi:hypothetical protein
MNAALAWLYENKEWVFGGIGAAIITAIIHRRSQSQRQRSGDKSTNIQAGRDVNMVDKDRRGGPDSEKRR